MSKPRKRKKRCKKKDILIEEEKVDKERVKEKNKKYNRW